MMPSLTSVLPVPTSMVPAPESVPALVKPPGRLNVAPDASSTLPACKNVGALTSTVPAEDFSVPLLMKALAMELLPRVNVWPLPLPSMMPLFTQPPPALKLNNWPSPCSVTPLAMVTVPLLLALLASRVPFACVSVAEVAPEARLMLAAAASK